MTQILFGERIGKRGKIRLGCSAVILDDTKEKILLTQRADTGQWCLPSGLVEAGESVSEACIRETHEETGLEVQVERLTTIFSDPNRLVVYADGAQFQIITLNFEARPLAGRIGLSDETVSIGYFSIPELDCMDVFPHHKQFIADTLANQDATFIR